MMASQYAFHGPNAGYIYELYERYLNEPESLDAATRAFFAAWRPPVTDSDGTVQSPSAPSIAMEKIVGAVSYAQAIRQFGHTQAQLDPLGTPPPGDPELYIRRHGISEDDLRALPAGLIVEGPLAASSANAYEAIETLKQIYAAHIGYDNDHIRIPEERTWLRENIEARRYRFNDQPEESRALMRRLIQVDSFENFLQKNFPTKYRFSVEGLDMMIPMLDEIVRLAKASGVEVVVIAMAHRGRLNVLAHVMNKPYEEIIADFVDPIEVQEKREAIGWQVGDVKYHKAWQHIEQRPDGTSFKLTMPANPSHLEAVNPVAVGMARAAGTTTSQRGLPDFDPHKTLQIIIHGDAAFPGQGIVAETLNLSKLPGYWTGGTIHIIANNQLGFTTLPKDSRSTLYASDLAKGFKMPVVHVNADDPAACIEVARLAHGYQEHFEKDFLIDLVGYRRYGHNELDEPGFTQPLMYQTVRRHPRVYQTWTRHLAERKVTTSADADAYAKQLEENLGEVLNKLSAESLRAKPPEKPEPGAARKVITAILEEHLTALNDGLAGVLEGFNFYSPRLEKAVRNRRTVLNDFDAPGIDWAGAEEFALASVLADGIPVRLTGQDSERGTFSHRHAVLYDSQTGQPLTPLGEMPQARASFEVRNSPLSEAGALGFEYGYNIQEPGHLVIWEAQYGDFINGAQTVIDEFIVSAREKWGHTPSLVLLLPHGHEGAGPDHSSARLERFLSLAAKTNMRIAYPTSAAQYFHLLRRQALLLESDPLPLVVMSPKSLLRNPDVASAPRTLTTGKWQPVIDDASADPDQVTRLVFISGKFYFDLMGSPLRAEHPETAIVRVEQLYPFPSDELRAVLESYPHVRQIIWAQEEPKNMGAWEFMGYRLKKLVGPSIPVNYVGRRRSSSPAEGSKALWAVNQEIVIRAVYEHRWAHSSGETAE